MLAAQPCFGAMTGQESFEWERIVFINAVRVAMHSIADGSRIGEKRISLRYLLGLRYLVSFIT